MLLLLLALAASAWLHTARRRARRPGTSLPPGREPDLPEVAYLLGGRGLADAVITRMHEDGRITLDARGRIGVRDAVAHHPLERALLARCGADWAVSLRRLRTSLQFDDAVDAVESSLADLGLLISAQAKARWRRAAALHVAAQAVAAAVAVVLLFRPDVYPAPFVLLAVAAAGWCSTSNAARRTGGSTVRIGAKTSPAPCGQAAPGASSIRSSTPRGPPVWSRWEVWTACRADCCATISGRPPERAHAGPAAGAARPLLLTTPPASPAPPAPALPAAPVVRAVRAAPAGAAVAHPAARAPAPVRAAAAVAAAPLLPDPRAGKADSHMIIAALVALLALLAPRPGSGTRAATPMSPECSPRGCPACWRPPTCGTTGRGSPTPSSSVCTRTDGSP
ncbi:TIGR04222 domain-containing membrane protein [Streptomyces stramineus]